MATKPGERRLQILQTLAEMLETPKGEKITTAALAAKLDCSEAALYRHFASKAQMFEGLIEFIEQSLFGVINQITSEETEGFKQIEQIIGLLLRFAQRQARHRRQVQRRVTLAPVFDERDVGIGSSDGVHHGFGLLREGKGRRRG